MLKQTEMGVEAEMADEQTPEFELLHSWMQGVAGAIDLGVGEIKSTEISKSGRKLTLVLKRPKEAKKARRTFANKKKAK